mmetsp:Transcript_30048/g.65688  ORF Transcript_30048/g.65688 Transcript_30048/m.65688 type:complete len:204 (+) Transcript_30048:620-1231(+)
MPPDVINPITSENKLPSAAAAMVESPKATPNCISMASPARIIIKLSMKPNPMKGTNPANATWSRVLRLGIAHELGFSSSVGSFVAANVQAMTSSTAFSNSLRVSEPSASLSCLANQKPDRDPACPGCKPLLPYSCVRISTISCRRWSLVSCSTMARAFRVSFTTASLSREAATMGPIGSRRVDSSCCTLCTSAEEENSATSEP